MILFSLRNWIKYW